MTATDRIQTGIDGLDDVLSGGFLPERNYMVRGEPGTGKTFLGLHFLVAGVDDGEDVLYVGLEESEEAVRTNARSAGLDLSGVEILDLTPASEMFADAATYDVFEAWDVEQDALIDRLTDRVDVVEPTRLFIDPITQLRFLTPDQYQFRQQVLSLSKFFGDRGTTVMFSSQSASELSDQDLQFLADGVIDLSLATNRRTLQVPKFRGSDTVDGPHTLRITDDGILIFPKAGSGGRVADDYDQTPVSSGIPEVDELMHGGLDAGTVTILSGPTGVGKTTLATQFMKEAAGRGERSAIYLFEEIEETFLNRSEAVNIPVGRMRDRGTLRVQEVEAIDLSPQEFAHRVRQDCEEEETAIVMFDGIPGYKQSIQGGSEALTHHLHRLTRHLKRRGITVILTEDVPSLTGDFRATGSNVSYLADNIILLRYVEVRGELRKMIGVLKMRASDFETRLREFQITENGIKVGEPLTGLRGILTGTPELSGAETARFIEAGGPDERE